MKPAPQSVEPGSVSRSDAPATPASGEGAATGAIQPVLLSKARSAPAPIRLDNVVARQRLEASVTQPRPAPDGEVCSADAVYTGETLRLAREARGLSIEQICERTRITRQHLENVEADHYDRLPAPVYLRGILMALAKQLRLDGQKVARSYMDASAAAQAPRPR